jgi:hypothetical protein
MRTAYRGSPRSHESHPRLQLVDQALPDRSLVERRTAGVFYRVFRRVPIDGTHTEMKEQR